MQRGVAGISDEEEPVRASEEADPIHRRGRGRGIGAGEEERLGGSGGNGTSASDLPSGLNGDAGGFADDEAQCQASVAGPYAANPNGNLTFPTDALEAEGGEADGRGPEETEGAAADVSRGGGSGDLLNASNDLPTRPEVEANGETTVWGGAKTNRAPLRCGRGAGQEESGKEREKSQWAAHGIQDGA